MSKCNFPSFTIPIPAPSLKVSVPDFSLPAPPKPPALPGLPPFPGFAIPIPSPSLTVPVPDFSLPAPPACPFD